MAIFIFDVKGKGREIIYDCGQLLFVVVELIWRGEKDAKKEVMGEKRKPM